MKIYTLLLFASLAFSLPTNPEEQIRKQKEHVQELSTKYCRNGYSVVKVCKRLPKEMGALAATGAVSLMATYCARALEMMGQDEGDESYRAMRRMLLINSAIAGTVSTAIHRIFDLILKCKLTKLEGLQKVHEILIQESRQDAAKLPPNLREALEKFDSKIKTYISSSIRDDGVIYSPPPNEDSEFKAAFRMLEFRQVLVVGFPKAPKDIHSERNSRKVLERVNGLIENVPKDEQQSMRVFINRIQDNSYLQNPETMRKAMVYLHGEPGTGKTYFGKRIASALGLPMCDISLKNKGLERQLIGGSDISNGYRHQSMRGGDSDQESDQVEDYMGAIARCMLLKGVTNPIIFVDEAGETLQQTHSQEISFLKRITEQSERSLFIPALDTTIDISRVTFVFAGNYKIGDAALQSRIKQVSFGKVAREQRERILNVAFDEAKQNLVQVIPGTKERNKIMKEAKKYTDEMLDLDLEKNDGVRILISVAHDLVEHIRMLLSAQLPVLREEIATFLNRAFDAYGSGRKMKDDGPLRFRQDPILPSQGEDY